MLARGWRYYVNINVSYKKEKFKKRYPSIQSITNQIANTIQIQFYSLLLILNVKIT
jgi:hypothetical protein